MMKIVFFCIPAHGHINPTLGVVEELIKRNNEVYYYSYDEMREKIENTGACFISCSKYDAQTALREADKEKASKDLAFSVNLIVDMTLNLETAILKDMAKIKPDVIVSDSVAFWGKLIAQKLNIPFVSSTTTFAFNKYSAKLMKSKGPGILQLIRSIPGLRKSLRRLRKKNYKVKSVLDIIANSNDTPTIVYTSEFFQPFSQTFSDNFRFVGPVIRKSTDVFERTAAPTVYISLGTVNNGNTDFYKCCFEALGNERLRVIMPVGEGTDIKKLDNIPSNFTVLNFADQISALKAADVFITHCGMNSTGEALYFGVPLVLFPQTAEQYAVARRVQELGAGYFLQEYDSVGIKHAVSKVLNNKIYKENALQISDSFKKSGGAKEAAQYIESQKRFL